MKRELLLQLLQTEDGSAVSGEKIGQALNISRAAVWKQISLLRKEGWDIRASSGGGYVLNRESDLLSQSLIASALTTERLGRPLELLQSVDSTNSYLKQHAAELPHGYAVISETQTGGRGRMGRSFYSPGSGGVYLSVLLRPSLSIEAVQLITLAAALSVTDMIHSLYGLDTQIKWVNDVLINGKKLCGILTEASITGENAALEYAVVGIGVNVSTRSFPEDVALVATSLCAASGRCISRNRVAAVLLNCLEQRFDMLCRGERTLLMRDYRARLAFVGQRVLVIRGNERYEALLCGVDDSGALIVEDDAGQQHRLSSGEISIRPTHGGCSAPAES